MTLNTAPVRTSADAVCEYEGIDLAGLSRAELMALTRAAAELCRNAQVILAQAAAETDRRSQPSDGHAGLASSEGFRSGREMIAGTTGGSLAEAGRLIAAGTLMADAGGRDAAAGQQGALDGDGGFSANDAPETPAPPPTPLEEFRSELAKAVRTGTVSVEVSAAFTEALCALPDVERTRKLFAQALEKAPGLPLHKVRRLVWRAQAFSDPQAWADREEQQHEARSVSVRDDADGMVTLVARLTPLAAAPVKALLDAGVRRAMQQRRDDPESDTRTPWQMKADLLHDMCKHMLDCDHATTGVKTTVVVRMTLDDLQNRMGIGDIDGSPQPVSASALRLAAGDARVIPAVLRGKSEVLDLGRAKRLFTPEQRLALAERDGGCAWCNAPPAWCEGHHVGEWERDEGLTDLANGVLLCTKCHHRLHRNGWTIEVKDNQVWFIPPRDVDPAQTPRLGGRARYDIAA